MCVCVTDSVSRAVCREKGRLRQGPKASPSSAGRVLGVFEPFLVNEGLDYTISRGLPDSDTLPFPGWSGQYVLCCRWFFDSQQTCARLCRVCLCASLGLASSPRLGLSPGANVSDLNVVLFQID